MADPKRRVPIDERTLLLLMHDVNNVAGALSLEVATLRTLVNQPRGPVEDEEIRTHVERLNRTLNVLLSSLRSGRDIGRAGAVSGEAYAVADLVDAAARTVKGSSQLHVDALPGGKTTISPGLLSRVVINLVKNAMEATADQPDGLVVLRGYDAGGDMSIEVVDNGPGLLDSANEEGGVFALFTTTKAEGTGVGLASCREFVHQWGGHLRVSTVHGKGTRFTFTVPRVAD